LLLNKAGFRVKSFIPDDHLWITATRYLQKRKYKWLRYVGLAGVNTIGKIIRMQNQFIVIATKSDFTVFNHQN
jgi:hypothetical protein